MAMGQVCSTYIGIYLNGPHDSMQKPINQCNSKGPSLYYVSIFLAFLDPTHPPYQHKYSTERQAANLAFFDPTT